MLIVILSRWWGPVGICGRIVGRIFLGSSHWTRHQAKMRDRVRDQEAFDEIEGRIRRRRPSTTKSFAQGFLPNRRSFLSGFLIGL